MTTEDIAFWVGVAVAAVCGAAFYAAPSIETALSAVALQTTASLIVLMVWAANSGASQPRRRK